jgi:hypothetical protein
MMACPVSRFPWPSGFLGTVDSIPKHCLPIIRFPRDHGDSGDCISLGALDQLQPSSTEHSLAFREKRLLFTKFSAIVKTASKSRHSGDQPGVIFALTFPLFY